MLNETVFVGLFTSFFFCNEPLLKGNIMLTKKQTLAVKLVLHMHIFAGLILDMADAIESRIVFK